MAALEKPTGAGATAGTAGIKPAATGGGANVAAGFMPAQARSTPPGASAPQPLHAAAAPVKAAPLPKDLDLPVTAVKGVAGPMAARLHKLGIETVRDVLYHFPRRYNDFSRFKAISQLRAGEEVTILVHVWDIAAQKVRPGLTLVEAAVGDETGNLRVRL